MIVIARSVQNRWAQVGLVLFGISVAVVIAEWVARDVPALATNGMRLGQFMESEKGKFCRYDRVLGWEGVPDIDLDFEWVDCKCRVRQNRYGFRGPAYDFSRTAHRRVAVLGDSFVWGFGVDEPDLFTDVMRRTSPVSLEVVNLGVSGYGNDQELLLWEKKGYQWHPDQVLLFISMDTDLYDNAAPRRYGYAKPAFTLTRSGELTLKNVPVPREAPVNPEAVPIQPQRHRLLRGLLRHSAVARRVAAITCRSRAVRAYLENNWIIPKSQITHANEYSIFQIPYDASFLQAWRLMASLITKLNRDVTAQGSQLTLVLVPSRVQVYPGLADQLTREVPLPSGQTWDFTAPNREISRFARTAGIEVIDLLPGLSAAGAKDPGLYFPYNLHWTAAGHQVVAEQLLKNGL